MEVILLLVSFFVELILGIIAYSMIQGKDKTGRIIGWIIVIATLGGAFVCYYCFPDYRVNHKALYRTLEIITSIVVLLLVAMAEGSNKNE